MDYNTDSEQSTISKRNMGIFYMVLNYLGLPDHLHEFVIATFLAGNWNTDEMEEISLMRMARALAHDRVVQLKIYNRLKKNSPKFFTWQDKQSFTIIDRLIIHEHTTHHKTKAKYRFLLAKLVHKLFDLPIEMSPTATRRAVDRSMQGFPSIKPPIRKPKQKRPESVARAIRKNIQTLIDLTGSQVGAILYLKEADPFGELNTFITQYLKIGVANKGVDRKSGEFHVPE